MKNSNLHPPVNNVCIDYNILLDNNIAWIWIYGEAHSMLKNLKNDYDFFSMPHHFS